VIVLLGMLLLPNYFVVYTLSSTRESASCTHISDLLHALVALCPIEINSTASADYHIASIIQPVP